jgi:shikimate kinase
MNVVDPPLSPAEVQTIVRRLDRPIALVGMMGVGKSSVGKRLAAQLQLPFTDVDEAIETSARMTVPEIFARFGEPYFRDGERRVIARLVQENQGRGVIATGGGAFCNPGTRTLLLDRAIAVWLDCDVETLVERTARKDNRPLLRDGDPHEVLSRLSVERRPHYAHAPIHVVSGGGAHERTVARVLRGIDAWL